MEIDQLVEKFLQEREQGLQNLHRLYGQNKDQLSLRALKEELLPELKTGCITFINKGSPIEEINNYLFYIANSFCKKLQKTAIKPKAEYICPACLYLGKDCFPIFYKNIFQCPECLDELKKSSNPQKILLFETFAKHNKKGFRCPDCQRFIPLPLDNISGTVSCPYFDCVFAGNINGLDRMHHPTSKHNPECIILDGSKINSSSSLKESISANEANIHFQLETAEDLQAKISTLQHIIETQSNAIHYNSIHATIKHKQFIYQAFSKLLQQFPIEMTGYLLQTSTSHNGFQHKIFQEYIALLEAALPLIVIKNKKPIKINSLLDNSLSLFDGISVFESIVSDKLSIKNETKEFYIGGRKAACTKPFYIGKLLNVIDKRSKKSLLHLVEEYSFSKIKMRDIEPETEVIITHLRIPPHYEAGQMKTINRVRKKIVERALEVIK